ALDQASWSVVTGIVAGLVIGKPVGVVLASWLAIRLNVASVPEGITMKHMAVLGAVAGVGFTMALFIAQLAFTDPTLLTAAKLGVLVASAAAGILGLAGGRLLLAR
ncbi:MAG: Na+/H+ antiporter NhaA, partial [Candidatus Binatia bacterium]